jgi:hypothetical protein
LTVYPAVKKLAKIFRFISIWIQLPLGIEAYEAQRDLDPSITMPRKPLIGKPEQPAEFSPTCVPTKGLDSPDFPRNYWDSWSIQSIRPFVERFQAHQTLMT